MENLSSEIKQLEKDGWILCCGCIHSFDDDCEGCGIEKRKIMGLSPYQVKRLEKDGE